MVLNPTMSCIKAIGPSNVEFLLTKAWVNKIEAVAVNETHVKVALPYL